MKTTKQREMLRYNMLVKPQYTLNSESFEYVLCDLLEMHPDTAEIPYYEIPSNETKSGKAVFFELEPFERDLT